MRSKVSIISSVFLVLCFFILTNPAKAQEPEFQLYAVSEAVVFPNKAMEYEAGLKEVKALFTKLEFPRPWTVYRTDDFHYYFLIPLESFASMDSLFQYFMQVEAKAGEEIQALEKRFEGTSESETSGIVALRNDLSYIPENPRVSQEEMNFIWWSYFYLLPGKQKEAEAIAKEYQALYKSHNIQDGFNVYQPVMWSDLPSLVAAGGAKSEADYYNQVEKIMKLTGGKYEELGMKSMALCRKFEQRTGVILKELSYVPKKK